MTLILKILWVVNNHNLEKIMLGSYAILNPNVEWCNIDMSDFEFKNQITVIDINELDKKEIIDYIQSQLPNILIFNGTFSSFNCEELEAIGWDITYSSKMFVNNDRLGDTTSFYITSKEKLCIVTKTPNNYSESDKLFWCEIKMAIKTWEEMR
ncbi:MAG: hypothetical protein ACOYMD_13205 [Paludibacter sp.]